MQRTLQSPIDLTGTGLHTGRAVHMTLRPAPARTGLWFHRTDIAADGTGRDPRIAARWDNVQPSELCTRLVNAQGVDVATIEHVMAAFAGCGVHNAVVEVDGPEVPILDGSAAPLVAAILRSGLSAQRAPLEAIEVLEHVAVRNGPAYAELTPADALEMDFRIDFEDAAIGRQDKFLRLANGSFVHELADSRTFCRRADVEAMRARGLALGGTMTNAVVVDGAIVLSPGGLRHADEPVRHKMLDALGDLALTGAPLLARYTGNRAGHAMTNALLRALFARPGSYRRVRVDAALASRLPGAGLVPADADRIAA